MGEKVSRALERPLNVIQPIRQSKGNGYRRFNLIFTLNFLALFREQAAVSFCGYDIWEKGLSKAPPFYTV